LPLKSHASDCIMLCIDMMNYEASNELCFGVMLLNKMAYPVVNAIKEFGIVGKFSTVPYIFTEPLQDAIFVELHTKNARHIKYSEKFQSTLRPLRFQDARRNKSTYKSIKKEN